MSLLYNSSLSAGILLLLAGDIRFSCEERGYGGPVKESRRLSPAIGPAGGATALFCCVQTLFECLDFGVQSFGKMAAEAGEVFLDRRHFRQPAFDIDAEQFVHLGAMFNPLVSRSAASGIRPMGVSLACTLPSQRSKIHFNTRLFSP